MKKYSIKKSEHIAPGSYIGHVVRGHIMWNKGKLKMESLMMPSKMERYDNFFKKNLVEDELYSMGGMISGGIQAHFILVEGGVVLHTQMVFSDHKHLRDQLQLISDLHNNQGLTWHQSMDIVAL